MRRSYLLVGVLVALAVALWLPSAQIVLRDWVIVPLLKAGWFAKLMFESIPQAFVWGFLVLVALLAVWGGRGFRSYAVAVAPRPWTEQAGLLGPWARLVFQSANDDYARWRLAQRLTLLAQSVLGLRSPTELRRYLNSDSAEVPTAIRAYLLAGLSTYTPQRRLMPLALLDSNERRGSGPLALDPEQVVAFLETRSRTAEGLND